MGQLLGTYLLAEDKDGLLLIDQHAAHERVLYERLRATWLEGGVERQGLLTPTQVELEAPAAAALIADAERVERLGFEVAAFGEAAVVVRAVPALLAERDPLGLLRGLAEELRQADAIGADLSGGTRVLDAADQLFASLACHSARRAGDVLPEGEQRALLDSLDSIPWAPTCPHGATGRDPSQPVRDREALLTTIESRPLAGPRSSAYRPRDVDRGRCGGSGGSDRRREDGASLRACRAF